MVARKKPRGRPPKAAADRKRNNLTLRIRDAMRRQLQREAEKNRRSLSEEAEARIERSFHEQELLPEILDLAFGGRLGGLLYAIGSSVAPLGPVWAIQHTGYRASDGDTLRGLGDAFRQAAANWPDDPYAYDQLMIVTHEILERLRPAGDRTIPEQGEVATYDGHKTATHALSELKDPPAEPVEPHDRWRLHARRMLGQQVIDRIRVLNFKVPRK